EIDTNASTYRGSIKLEHALNVFNVDVRGKRALDIGASTGGFTYVLLEHGAIKVCAVDVGHLQFDNELRSDPRVELHEGINARYIKPDDFGLFDIITIDVSFISLTKILEPVLKCLENGGVCIALIKPQFEAGPENLNKNGIVTDKSVHFKVLNNIIDYILRIGYTATGLIPSPVKGKSGNTEYFTRISLHGIWDFEIEPAINSAFLD
ncbi:MAG TPA: TlyA family RNA methyltransferase, partial [Clostridia bacterium]|nr:TlyA family RNA methyltransferase [Clostridia bacterium]